MSGDDEKVRDVGPVRERIWRIIFLSDTRAGQVFDIILLVLIGALVTNAKDALGFFFGTSQSSQEKSDLLARNGRSGGHET